MNHVFMIAPLFQTNWLSWLTVRPPSHPCKPTGWSESVYTAGMAYDPEATKAKFLDAAYKEFAAYGLAGARVDRIAERARANKQAIYAYFGSKDALFDAVLEQRHHHLVDAVPFTPLDLPGYGVALYDYLLQDPDYLRLMLWRQLERDDAGGDLTDSYRVKSEQIGATIDMSDLAFEPLDVLLIVVNIARTWQSTAPSLRTAGTRSRAVSTRRKQHREAVRTAIAALVNELGGP